MYILQLKAMNLIFVYISIIVITCRGQREEKNTSFCQSELLNIRNRHYSNSSLLYLREENYMNTKTFDVY